MTERQFEEKKARYEMLLILDQRLYEDAIMLEECKIEHGGIRKRLRELRKELKIHLNSQEYSIKKREK